MRAGLADQHAAALAEAGDAEGGEEQVQQAGVVGVAHVLEIELPVVRQRLGEAADDLQLAVAQHAADAAGDVRAEPGFDVGRVGRQRAEHQAAEVVTRSLRGPCCVMSKSAGMPPLPLTPWRNATEQQVAAQVVAPGVIDALEVLRRAAVFQADQRAAMRAAVLEGAQLAVFGARDDDRHAADEGGAVVADVGELGLQAEEVPDRAFEDALLLGAQHVVLGVDPVGHAGEPRGPTAAGHKVGDSIHRKPPLPTLVMVADQFNRGSGTRAATSTSTEAAPAASSAAAQALAVAPEVITSSISSTRRPASAIRARWPHRERAGDLRGALGRRLLAERGGGALPHQRVRQARAGRRCAPTACASSAAWL